MKFRKKPVVINAYQFFKDRWASRAPPEFFEAVIIDELQIHSPYIQTLEGKHLVTEGDWIIRGIMGEFYPCKPDIFAATYECAEPVISLDPPTK